jgi:ATP-dependent DNA ligase
VAARIVPNARALTSDTMAVMQLPVMPPVAPMLAKAVSEIPPGASYEPKWDGFRAVIFRDGPEVEIGSRNERPMTRYFPELVRAFGAELPPRCVVDGEIVVATEHGLDFEVLQQRIHPAASRVTMLAGQTPAAFVAFDLLALGEENLMGRPFAERRERLEHVLGPGVETVGEVSRQAADPAVRRVHLTPATRDRDTAREWFSQFEGAGLDGIVAKPLAGTYQPDKRVMFKIKHERTADCVVAGYRLHKSGPDAIGSLLLGLYDDSGALASVGVIGAFPMARRRELFTELQPLVTGFDGHPWNWGEAVSGADATAARNPRSGEGSRWNAGKDLSFVPLRPELVVEVRYDHMEGARFRHTAQFSRWRPDRTPQSCTYAQLEQPVTFSLDDIVPGLGATAGSA